MRLSLCSGAWWRGVVAWPLVRCVGVSQSLFVILDRGMLGNDEKGELDSLVGCCGGRFDCK